MVKLKQQIVKKAGGIVRDWKNFFAVSRNQYNDISLPKWHIEAWETAEQAALREVLEETWFECEILETIWDTEYLNFEWIVQVRYFAMRIKNKVSDQLFPDVDALIYWNAEKIYNQLSYTTDKNIFEKAVKFFKNNM